MRGRAFLLAGGLLIAPVQAQTMDREGGLLPVPDQLFFAPHSLAGPMLKPFVASVVRPVPAETGQPAAASGEAAPHAGSPQMLAQVESRQKIIQQAKALREAAAAAKAAAEAEAAAQAEAAAAAETDAAAASEAEAAVQAPAEEQQTASAPEAGAAAEPDAAASLAPPATTIRVIVENVESASGTVNVAVCDTALSQDGCPYHTEVPAAVGFVEATFDNVPPGVYAVVGYHDVNGNSNFDKFMGIPREPYALSGAAAKELVPHFEDATLKINQGENYVIIHMKRLGSG